MKITNLLFWVQDNKTSERFYKKLGFKVLHTDDQYSVVELDGFQIMLITMRDENEFAKDSMAAEKGRGMYVYVSVGDVDAKYEELIGIGLKPVTQPRDWPWGNREFILKDPDGYKLCFWHLVEN